MMARKAYPEFMMALRAYYNSPIAPPLSAAYRRAHYLAHDRGWPVPSISTARRLMRRAA